MISVDKFFQWCYSNHKSKLIEVAPNISTAFDVSGAGEEAEKERVPKGCDA